MEAAGSLGACERGRRGEIRQGPCGGEKKWSHRILELEETFENV